MNCEEINNYAKKVKSYLKNTKLNDLSRLMQITRMDNIGRGKAVEVQYILDTALSFSDMDIKVSRDPARMRASDIPIIEPDVSRIAADTGWKAEISMEQTIRDSLDYWRSHPEVK